MVNVHCAGTTAMMKAALEGLIREDGTRPILIAVTQLTSTDQESMERDLLIHRNKKETVMHYAKTATRRTGRSSLFAAEAEKVPEECGADFLTVTPGISFADSEADDQKR